MSVDKKQSINTIQNTLSIDIGINNLGYAILYGDEESIFKCKLTFDLFNIDNNKEIKKYGNVIGRTYVLTNFLNEIIETNNITKVIIERQVNSNTIAMEIMYAIVGIISTKISIENVVIFDPKLKFTKLRKSYNTKNKNHKKQSIRYAEIVLSNYYPFLMDSFNSNVKKDDISDAIIMLFIINATYEELVVLSKIID